MALAARKSKHNGPEMRKQGRAWLDRIAAAAKLEKTWLDDAEKAVKACTGELEGEAAGRIVAGDTYDFNVLFANTETIVPAVINSPPAPDIRRRFGDADPAANDVAGLLERHPRAGR